MQLVMLARALVQHTSVIIMDEPSAHLDFRNELIFLENAARLIREQSASVIMLPIRRISRFSSSGRGFA